MARLIQVLGDSLPAEALEKLYSNRIKTADQLLSTDIPALAHTTGLSCQFLLSVRHHLLAQVSMLPVRGDDLYKHMLSSTLICSTGVSGLDSLLCGGAYSGELLEIVGLTAAGKTQLCLNLALQTAIEHDCRVVFVDSGGSFSARRLFQMAAARGLKDTRWQTLIHSVNVFDIFEALDFLETLQKTDKAEEALRPRLLVVDCITALLQGQLGGQHRQGQQQMARVLKSIAVHSSTVVVYTNNMVKSGAEPALGRTWRHVPNTRLKLQHVPPAYHSPNSSYKASLMKSSQQPCSLSTTFIISDSGLNDLTAADTLPP